MFDSSHRSIRGLCAGSAIRSCTRMQAASGSAGGGRARPRTAQASSQSSPWCRADQAWNRPCSSLNAASSRPCRLVARAASQLGRCRCQCFFWQAREQYCGPAQPPHFRNRWAPVSTAMHWWQRTTSRPCSTASSSSIWLKASWLVRSSPRLIRRAYWAGRSRRPICASSDVVIRVPIMRRSRNVPSGSCRMVTTPPTTAPGCALELSSSRRAEKFPAPMAASASDRGTASHFATAKVGVASGE
mmetsp:Transcript_37571/g.58685  ORF Transcript_37571/g.58685 Transcript_37571/m.58685 type:complete len:244 (+) Transcript_37571:223-954(+)